MSEVLSQLSQYPIQTRVSLTGTLVVARDIAHAKIQELLDAGQPMPDYLKQHPVYYAGPAKTPEVGTLPRPLPPPRLLRRPEEEHVRPCPQLYA